MSGQVKARNKISRFVAKKFVTKGLLRGSPLWLLLGVFITVFKTVSVLAPKGKQDQYISTALEPGDRLSFIQIFQSKSG